jgi:tRNA pseudouridine38-40 synthase
MNYKLVFAYDGSKYFGYAVQKNEEHTVQAVIEKAISTILNKETKIYASGRTDRGVHALNQVANFHCDHLLDEAKFLRSLNKLIPNDIYFKKITKVDEKFNARFSAVAKEYIYIINYKEYDPFRRAYELLDTKIDYDLLLATSQIFVGTHNFQNFTSKPTDDKNFVRTIYSISFKRKEGRIYIDFKGDGFMTYMIRKIIGALLEVNKGNLKTDEILNLLNLEKREIITYTAPPEGLFLKRVYYK